MTAAADNSPAAVLPHKAGTYDVSCPTCGRPLRVRVKKREESTGTRWEYRYNICRACGTLQVGLLPR